MALLSGEMMVEQRAAVIERFREGKEKVLVTTNVCARGEQRLAAPFTGGEGPGSCEQEKCSYPCSHGGGRALGTFLCRRESASPWAVRTTWKKPAVLPWWEETQGSGYWLSDFWQSSVLLPRLQSCRCPL